jgi:two-component system response regulator (stage 0 sporulation protein A)
LGEGNCRIYQRLELKLKKKELEIFKVITYYLLKMGFQARNRGYRYLRDAIIIGYVNNNMLKSVTKRLYPVIAEKYDVTVFQVESSIRNAIELAWDEGNPTELRACLGACVDSEIRPTNSEVIERLVGFISNLK